MSVLPAVPMTCRWKCRMVRSTFVEMFAFSLLNRNSKNKQSFEKCFQCLLLLSSSTIARVFGGIVHVKFGAAVPRPEKSIEYTKNIRGCKIEIYYALFARCARNLKTEKNNGKSIAELSARTEIRSLRIRKSRAPFARKQKKKKKMR